VGVGVFAVIVGHGHVESFSGYPNDAVEPSGGLVIGKGGAL